MVDLMVGMSPLISDVLFGSVKSSKILFVHLTGRMPCTCEITSLLSYLWTIMPTYRQTVILGVVNFVFLARFLVRGSYHVVILHPYIYVRCLAN